MSEAVKSVRINTAMGKKSAMLLGIVCNNIIIYYRGQDAIGRMFTPELVIGMYWGGKKKEDWNSLLPPWTTDSIIQFL